MAILREGSGVTEWGQKTYGAMFSGLLSVKDGKMVPRYTRETLKLAEAWGIDHYAQVDGDGNAEQVAQKLIKYHETKWLGETLVLGGHSQGAKAALIVQEILRERGVPVDVVILLDMTASLSIPAIQPGVKYVRHFEGSSSIIAKINQKVKLASGFDGDFKRVMVKGLHVEMLEDPLIRTLGDELIKTFSTAKEETKMQIPEKLAKMENQVAQAMLEENEAPSDTRFNEAFFNSIRPLFGSLSPGQVHQMKVINYCFTRFIAPKLPNDNDRNNLWAFTLANGYHETGATMAAIRETNASTDEKAIAILNGWWASGKAKAAGVRAPYWRGGHFGRGLIQVTHESGYQEIDEAFERWFGFRLGLAENPSLMLDAVVSALAAFIGIHDGVFTGKKLSDFVKPNGNIDWAAARSIINGDRYIVRVDADGDGKRETMGEEIKGLCVLFWVAIMDGLKNANTVTDPVVPAPDPSPVPVDPSQGGKITLDYLRQFPNQTLGELQRNAADMISLISIVRDERDTSAGNGFTATVEKVTNMGTSSNVGANAKPFFRSGGVMGPLLTALVSIATPILAGDDPVIRENLGELLPGLLTMLLGGGAASFFRASTSAPITGVGSFITDKGVLASLVALAASVATAWIGIDISQPVQDQLVLILASILGGAGAGVGIMGNVYRSTSIGKPK